MKALSMKPLKQTANPVSAGVCEGFLTAAFAIALFFLFTSGMPLVQLGLVHELSSKNSLGRTTLSVFFALLALAFSHYPEQAKQFRVIRSIDFLSQAAPGRQALVFFFIYVAVYGASGILKHYTLGTRAFDLGIFAQAVWNTLHGDFLFSSIKNNTNLLGDHFSPIVLMTVPFYAIFQTPITLILLQVLAAGLCFFFISKIAHEKTGNKFFVFALCLLYFFYLPTRGALHEDFHPEVLAEPLLFLAFWAIENGRMRLFLGSLLLAAAAKENFLGIVFFLGFYALVFKKYRTAGLLLMISSLGLFLFEVKYLIPTISQSRYLYEGFYKYLLSGPDAWRQLLGPDTWEYLLKIFVMFAFLPLFHLPTLVLTAPILLQNITSNNPVFRSFGYHYQTGLTPFLFIGTIYGFAVLMEKFPKLRKNQTALICLLIYAGLVRSSPAPYVPFFNAAKEMFPENRFIRVELSKIPADAVVLTHNSLIPHVCHRKFIYQFEYNGHPTKLEQAETLKAEYTVFYERFWEPGTLSFEETKTAFKNAGFQITAERDKFLIFKRGNL